MSTSPILRHAVRMALLGAGAFAASTIQSPLAQAQTTPNAGAAAAPELQEVIVTGSRIATPNLDSISPVTAVTSEEIKTTGVVRIEDLINSLPQVVADQGSGLSMDSNGTATLNLRGLGPQRTLVLVNGRRLGGGDPGANLGVTPGYASAADINQIPVALVERVDVLTGGASSTYGADAVAGVVNFVMNDHFEGVRVDANVGIYNHSNHEGWINPLLSADHFPTVTGTNWDGNNKDFTAIMGQAFADGAGHMEGYLGYRRTAPVTADHRDHAACTLSSVNSTAAAGPYICSGSSNSAPTVFYNGANGDGNSYQLDPNGNVVAKYARFNYAAEHYLERNDQRYTAGFMGKLKLNDHVEAYTEFSFMDDITTGAFAPAGAFLGSGKAIDSDTGLPDGNMAVNCGTPGSGYGNAGMNPYLTTSEYNSFCMGAPFTNATRATVGITSPAVLTNAAYQLSPTGDAQLLLARRNIEGGPREDNYTHTSYRGVVGLRGDITEGWTYDTYGEFSQTRSLDFHNNDTSSVNMQNALFAVKDPITGQIVCRGGQPGCVPWNIFNPSTPPSAAALAYISTPGLYSAESSEDVISSYVSGDLTSRGIKTPWSSDGVKLVFGTEYRRDTLNTQPDQEFLLGDLAGIGSPLPAASGEMHVWEAFTEARVPIVRDAPFMKALDFETGYRYSSYSEGFNTNTYKFGVEWAPGPDVRLRAGYNQAVRVPNLQEFFQPQHAALDGSIDFCAFGTKLTALQCSYLGVTAAQYGTDGVPASPASQYNGFIGGNPNLKPETAKTTNVGLVFTPSFLPGFNATLDYTDIKITNLVQSFGSSNIQANCLASADPDSSWCKLIHRGPNGDLWTSFSFYVVDPLLNEGSLENQGIDLGMADRFDMGSAGKIRSRLDAGYLLKLLYSPVGGKPYECAGQFGLTCSFASPPAPKYRHRLSVDWDTPLTGFSTGLTWRFYGTVDNAILNPSSPDYRPGFGIPVDAQIPHMSYLDLRLSYAINKITMRVGVNNVLDKDPPIIDTLNDTGNSPYGESNTFPSMYDTLGRYLYANFTIDF
jgi:iron complex outermembrane recepter protein